MHGTWPYGLFGWRAWLWPFGKRKAWFEEGSEILEAIASQVSGDIEFRAFGWSGRNSFFAREAAARELIGHLDAALIERPDVMHVVIGHSHGGTVAAKALADRSGSLRGNCRIRALICMATPFAYLLEPPAIFEEGMFGGAVGFFLAALVSIIFPDLWISMWHQFPDPSPGVFLGLVPTLLAVFFAACFLGVALWLHRSPRLFSIPPIHPSISVHLLRGTRDEATSRNARRSLAINRPSTVGSCANAFLDGNNF